MQPSLLEVLVIVAGVFLRRAGIPAAVVFLPLDTGLVQVLVIQAAIASAVSSTSLTRLYHGETPTALRVVVATQLNKSSGHHSALAFLRARPAHGGIGTGQWLIS
jgi:hypothetical protein